MVQVVKSAQSYSYRRPCRKSGLMRNPRRRYTRVWSLEGLLPRKEVVASEAGELGQL